MKMKDKKTKEKDEKGIFFEFLDFQFFFLFSILGLLA